MSLWPFVAPGLAPFDMCPSANVHRRPWKIRQIMEGGTVDLEGVHSRTVGNIRSSLFLTPG